MVFNNNSGAKSYHKVGLQNNHFFKKYILCKKNWHSMN